MLENYTMKDMYNGKLVRHNTVEDLTLWLRGSYATLTEGQAEMITKLGESLKAGDEHGIKWYGDACGLIITKKKTVRKRK